MPCIMSGPILWPYLEPCGPALELPGPPSPSTSLCCRFAQRHHSHRNPGPYTTNFEDWNLTACSLLDSTAQNVQSLLNSPKAATLLHGSCLAFSPGPRALQSLRDGQSPPRFSCQSKTWLSSYSSVNLISTADSTGSTKLGGGMAVASVSSPALSSIICPPSKATFSTGSILETLEQLRITGKDELPKELTVSESERSNIRHDEWKDLREIPVIDLSLLKTDRAGIVKQVREAVTEWGFFQVVNHGLALEVLQDAQAQGFKFFEMPLETKERAGTSENGTGPYIGDNTKQFVSTLHWAESLMFYMEEFESMVSQVWPDGNEEFRDAVTKFSFGADVVGKLLLELIAESLGLSTDFFAKHFNNNGAQSRRWNFYPACPRPTDSLGASSHTDGNIVTLLLQDKVGGLQIEKDGQWIGIRPIEGAFVVNMGDIMHAWTNGVCKSVSHRVVVNKEVHRLSFACFLSVDEQHPISAPKELIDENNPRRYKTLTTREYMSWIRHNRLKDKSLVRNGAVVLEDYFKFEN